MMNSFSPSENKRKSEKEYNSEHKNNLDQKFKEISHSKFEEAILHLTSSAEIAGKSFDDIFQIEGVPLWWFYNRLITRNMLPGLDSFDQIYNQVMKKSETYSEAKDSLLKIIKNNLNEKLLPFSEYTKQYLNPPKKLSGDNAGKIVLLTYTTHHTNNGIYRLS